MDFSKNDFSLSTFLDIPILKPLCFVKMSLIFVSSAFLHLKKNIKIFLKPSPYTIYWYSTTKVMLKFIYSEKATKFCEIFPFTFDCIYVVTVVKSKGKISQNFVAFSEYLNFTKAESFYNVKEWIVNYYVKESQ